MNIISAYWFNNCVVRGSWDGSVSWVVPGVCQCQCASPMCASHRADVSLCITDITGGVIIHFSSVWPSSNNGSRIYMRWNNVFLWACPGTVSAFLMVHLYWHQGCTHWLPIKPPGGEQCRCVNIFSIILLGRIHLGPCQPHPWHWPAQQHSHLLVSSASESTINWILCQCWAGNM